MHYLAYLANYVFKSSVSHLMLVSVERSKDDKPDQLLVNRHGMLQLYLKVSKTLIVMFIFKT
jgi:hypothetical protein